MSYVAPFPWFGGKRTVAAEVWSRLGPVANYVEPFFGSGAVLLARPDEPRVETINDVDHFVCNVWRAIQAAPAEVARHADWPVAEADLQSRHAWLVTEGRKRIARCVGDPLHFDAQVAGWWLWGACAWIGGGWCSGDGPWAWDGSEWVKGDAETGISRRRPHMFRGLGVNRQLPHGSGGRGAFIAEWLDGLSRRLRDVRIACGDWSRVCGDSVTWRHGLTGVFFDPPYGVADRVSVYSQDDRGVSAVARDWAIEAGRRPDMRIAFAGYEGEHEFPADWSAWAWKAQGGYANYGSGNGRANAGRERIWFSPACLAPRHPTLFASPADPQDERFADAFREPVA